MSCKHCKSIDGEVTPLAALGDVTVTIQHSRIVLKAHGSTASRAIDFCPVCGENLRLFGPAWVKSALSDER